MIGTMNFKKRFAQSEIDVRKRIYCSQSRKKKDLAVFFSMW